MRNRNLTDFSEHFSVGWCFLLAFPPDFKLFPSDLYAKLWRNNRKWRANLC